MPSRRSCSSSSGEETWNCRVRLPDTVAADGYSAQVELRLTVNVRFVNNTNHSEDFEQRFTASQTYDSTLQLTAVQDGLIEEMTKEIVDQIYNATVANW